MIFQPVALNFTPYFSYLDQGSWIRVVTCMLLFKLSKSYERSTVENAEVQTRGQILIDIFWKKITKFYNSFLLRKNEMTQIHLVVFLDY